MACHSRIRSSSTCHRLLNSSKKTDLTRYGILMLLGRDDLIHPDMPGNKWRKLRLDLSVIREAERQTLFTGAESA